MDVLCESWRFTNCPSWQLSPNDCISHPGVYCKTAIESWTSIQQVEGQCIKWGTWILDGNKNPPNNILSECAKPIYGWIIHLIILGGGGGGGFKQISNSEHTSFCSFYWIIDDNACSIPNDSHLEYIYESIKLCERALWGSECVDKDACDLNLMLKAGLTGLCYGNICQVIHNQVG